MGSYIRILQQGLAATQEKQTAREQEFEKQTDKLQNKITELQNKIASLKIEGSTRDPLLSTLQSIQDSTNNILGISAASIANPGASITDSVLGLSSYPIFKSSAEALRFTDDGRLPSLKWSTGLLTPTHTEPNQLLVSPTKKKGA